MTTNSFGPFDATVWGTVVEWCAFLSSIIAGVILFKTFKAQNTSALIEAKRYREVIKPSFILHAFSQKNADGKLVDVRFFIRQNDQIANNVSIHIVAENSNWTFENSYLDPIDNFRIHKNKTLIEEQIAFTGSYNYENESELFLILLNVRISFKDIIENKYTQLLNFSQFGIDSTPMIENYPPRLNDN